MTKEFFLALALVAGFSISAAFADEDKGRPASCLMVVKGEKVIDGECAFTPLDGNGSFQISSNDGKYFAYVQLTGKDVADGSWNEVPYASHAHTLLGTLHREKGCWVNDIATVCAY